MLEDKKMDGLDLNEKWFLNLEKNTGKREVEV